MDKGESSLKPGLQARFPQEAALFKSKRSRYSAPS